MFKYTQRTFNGGVLDKELMGRQDLSKYFCGASLLKNFLVRRQGNLAKRRGTDLTATVTNILGHSVNYRGEVTYGSVRRTRTVPIVYEREKGYYAFLCGKRAFLVNRDKGVYCRNGQWRKTISNYLSTRSSGSCEASDNPVAYIENVPYRTLEKACTACRPGQTIVLSANTTLTNGVVCYGVIDMNGKNITVMRNTAYIQFGRQACMGKNVGIVDSSHSGSTIIWDASVTQLSVNASFLRHGYGNFVFDGVSVAFPFTGASARLLYSTYARGTVRIRNCVLSGASGYGLVYVNGTDSAGGCDITIEESNLTTTNSSYPVFKTASSSNNCRKIHFKSGYVDAAGGVCDYGFRLEGGICDCASFGTSGGLEKYNKASAGLVSLQLSAGQILSGSSYKGTTTYEGNTFYNYNLSSEGPYVYTRNPATPTTPAVPTDYSPLFCNIPFEDGDLADIDTFQSGDTIFIAHKHYPPSKIVFSEDDWSLTYETLEFNATTWKRPVITSCQSSINLVKSDSSVSGTTTYRTDVTYNVAQSKRTTACYKVTSSATTLVTSSDSTLAPRTIKYCVTYVKDGVESAPSNPVSVTYLAPWESGGKVVINFSKGSNATEPDYYNIYKKESTEFGLIGSTSKPFATDLFPEMSGLDSDDATYEPSGEPCVTFNGEELKCSDPLDILNAVETNALTETPSRVIGALGEYNVFRGVGGVGFVTDEKAVFDFGANSGVSANVYNLSLDSHTMKYVEDTATGKVKVYDQMQLSGKRVRATVYYTPKTGTQTESHQTVTVNLNPVTYTPEGGTQQSAYSGSAEHYCGAFDPGALFSEVNAIVNRSVRSASVTFSNLSGGTNQVKKLVLEFLDDEDDGEGGTTEVAKQCYLNGIEFVNNDPRENSYEDDYITPDLTVTPPSDEAAFRGRGNYPSCVGLYQQRLIFAATADQPFGFWMSAVGDLYNFTPHSSIREDDAIEAELAATEFPNINHIVMNRDIIMLGDGGEWKIAPVTGNTITYKTISAELQSSIGSAKWLKPLTVGKEIIFAERTGMTLRSIVYNFSSDGYESTDLSVLSGNLFTDNRIERMCYKQHPDSTIECVLADGTVAVLVYMPEHEVAAWSQCVLGGGYGAKDIASSKALNGNTTDVLLTVRKGSETELWTVRPDLPEKTVDAQTCMDRVQRLTAADAASGWVSGWTAVDRATGASVTSAAGLVAGHEYLCGFVFDAEVATVRPEPAGEGTIQFEIKNAKDVEVRCLDGASWKVAPYGLVDHPTYAQKHTFNPTAVDGALTLDGADVRLVLTGKNGGDGRVHLKCTNPYPQSILSLSIDYEIQPMSNQEG